MESRIDHGARSFKEETKAKRKTLRVAVWLLFFASLTVVQSGCGLIPSEEDILRPPLITPVSVQYRTKAASLGSLVLDLRMTGTFASRIQVDLSFGSLGGRLKEMSVKLGQNVESGDVIAVLDSGSLDMQIRIQELEVDKNELILGRLKSTEADAATIAIQDITLQQQRIRLADMRMQFDATTLKSPIDGVVTYLFTLPTGEYVNAYQTVARIADPKALLLFTSDTDASNLPIGAEVSIRYKDATYSGKVLANPSTLFDDPNEFLRKAALLEFKDGLPDDAQMGDTASISYIQDHREGVIVLPRELIHLMSGRNYVNVLEDGVRVEKDVELGLMTDTEAEIVNGLNPGDLVIVG